SQTRIGILVRQHDVGIAFVVTQLDVVRRTEFFDQVLFQQQRFGFAVGHSNVYGRNVGHQRHCLGIQTTAAEIVADTLAQIACLADIEHLAGLVQHAVNTGPLAHDLQCCFGIKCCRAHTIFTSGSSRTPEISSTESATAFASASSSLPVALPWLTSTSACCVCTPASP